MTECQRTGKICSLEQALQALISNSVFKHIIQPNAECNILKYVALGIGLNHVDPSGIELQSRLAIISG